jgi:hypothetical protein
VVKYISAFNDNIDMPIKSSTATLALQKRTSGRKRQLESADSHEQTNPSFHMDDDEQDFDTKPGESKPTSRAPSRQSKKKKMKTT